MNFFQRRARLKNANYLEVTPVRAVDEEIDAQQQVTVLIPKVTSRLGKKYFEPMLKSPFIRLKLDEIGSASWLAIDGNKKVGDIAAEMSDKFGEKIAPVDERLTKFLTTLYEQRLITFQEIKGEK
jgi:hypothetical protein